MAIDLTPLTVVTGLPGSGKTLFTLTGVDEYSKREGFKVYYHGIPQLTLDWEMLEEPKQWHNLPNKSIIVIDESQSTFPPRSSSAAMPEHVAAANTLRHKSHMLVLITQHPMLIDGSIRKLCTKHYHVERFYGFQKSTIHEFLKIRDNCDKSTKGSISTHFVYPKEVFNWYKSADMHTIKRRIPARLIMIIILPLIAVALVYLFIKTVGGLTTGDKIKGGAASPTTGVQAVSGVIAVPVWTDTLKPRLSGFPHTAPRYDEVTKPTVAPYPAACVSSESRCVCHTQQGTKMLVDDALCRSIASNGFFNDFLEKKTDSSPVSQVPRPSLSSL
ncbi:MAG: hypothetical protein A2Z87_06190 [Gallionellales bacterium GWA2_54_124]|nr:MAG: hypothetical protein A2Z87_06190 [Gallionellales bacterium GWA2_54_124]